jgi:hypothetical protein
MTLSISAPRALSMITDTGLSAWRSCLRTSKPLSLGSITSRMSRSYSPLRAIERPSSPFWATSTW